MTEVVIKQIYVGMKPYVLIELDDIDDEGGVSMSIDFGGGVLEVEVPFMVQLAMEGLTGSDEE